MVLSCNMHIQTWRCGIMKRRMVSEMDASNAHKPSEVAAARALCTLTNRFFFFHCMVDEASNKRKS